MPTALQCQYASLERQRTALLERLGSYGDAQHAFQPDPESWSIAAVVQHLVLVEEAMVRYGRRQAETRPARVTLRSHLLGRIVVRALAFDIRVRAPARAVVPMEHIGLTELAPRWIVARADLLDYVEGLQGSRAWRTAFFHPRTGWITAMCGLRFFEGHCGHHLRQIERIAAAERFPQG
jgi:DinB family protein